MGGALLEDLDKETVDFRPNYDDSEQEPEVLPTRVPNLLVNGSSGIAEGLATNIPPHNLTEIIEATILMIQDPQTPLAKMLEIVKGPDFPTGGLILGRQGIVDAYTRGRGQLKIRARAAIERTGKDREQIIITEIPYQVNKSKLLEQMAAMVNEKRIEGISDVVDHSDRDGMRIVVDLKRGHRSEEHTSELQSHLNLVCRLLLEKKKHEHALQSHVNLLYRPLLLRSTASIAPNIGLAYWRTCFRSDPLTSCVLPP